MNDDDIFAKKIASKLTEKLNIQHSSYIDDRLSMARKIAMKSKKEQNHYLFNNQSISLVKNNIIKNWLIYITLTITLLYCFNITYNKTDINNNDESIDSATSYIKNNNDVINLYAKQIDYDVDKVLLLEDNVKD